MSRLFPIVIAFFCAACGPSVEDLIDDLGAGEVRYQALVALGLLESKLIEAQKEAVRLKARELDEDKHEGVRMEATINVENYVNQWIGEARQLEVQAEMARAESLYSKALAYSPHSKQGNYRMGRFYLDNGEREKGLDLLRRHGMLLEVPPLAEPPTIDGRIDEVEGWDAYGEAAVHVGADFWSVEYRLPVATDDFPRPRPGAIWGFNFVRVFRGSEYSQWVRTYGGNAHQPDDFGLLVFR